MTEILMALVKAAVLLLPVVLFALAATIVAVRRGEADLGHGMLHGVAAGEGHPAAADPAPAPPRELSVIEILILAAALFGVAMLALLGVSVMNNM
jgi:hypothetical protein